MAHALSKFAAITAAALVGTFSAAQGAPKPHTVPPLPGGGFGTPAQPRPPSDPHVIYILEQLTTGPLPRELMAQMEPIHTLQEVEALLKVNSIPFKWNRMLMHSAATPPQIVRQINALPPGEVFVVPQGTPPGQTMIFNVVLGTRPDDASVNPPQRTPEQP